MVTYAYDSATASGHFQMTNTPYLIAGGKTSALEFSIVPNADGNRRQVLNLCSTPGQPARGHLEHL